MITKNRITKFQFLIVRLKFFTKLYLSMLMMFQFLIVRLKLSALLLCLFPSLVSIPYSTIKMSVPVDALERANVFQFLIVRLKLYVEKGVEKSNEFQFLIVRLKSRLTCRMLR